jgi:hypothetical protein
MFVEEEEIDNVVGLFITTNGTVHQMCVCLCMDGVLAHVAGVCVCGLWTGRKQEREEMDRVKEGSRREAKAGGAAM